MGSIFVPKGKWNLCKRTLATLLLGAAAPMVLPAQKFTTLASFDRSDGARVR